MITLLIFEGEEIFDFLLSFFFFIFTKYELLECSFSRTLLTSFYLVHSETVAPPGLY